MSLRSKILLGVGAAGLLAGLISAAIEHFGGVEECCECAEECCCNACEAACELADPTEMA